VLSKRLRTPRSLKRYFGQLDALLQGLGQEVDFSDYATLTWLRTVEPGVYTLLQTHRAELIGEDRDPIRRITMAAEPTFNELRQTWLGRLEQAGVAEADHDDVLYVLSRLFPYFRDVYRGQEKQAKDHSLETIEDQRLAHQDYFDRYFAVGVPVDDIADTTVQKAVDALESGSAERDPSAWRLLIVFEQEPELVIRKLRSLAEHDPAPRPQLLRWLADRYEHAPNQSSTRARIEGLAAILAVPMVSEERIAVFKELAATVAGLNLFGEAQRLLEGVSIGPSSEIEARNAAAASLKPDLIDCLRSRLVSLANAFESPLDAPEETADLRWWWRLADPDGFKAFLADQVVRHRWTLLDEIAWMVPRGIGSDGKRYFTRFDSFEVHEGLFDLDLATTLYAAEVDTADLSRRFMYLEATADNRRDYVLTFLRQRRAQDRG